MQFERNALLVFLCRSGVFCCEVFTQLSVVLVTKRHCIEICRTDGSTVLVSQNTTYIIPEA